MKIFEKKSNNVIKIAQEDLNDAKLSSSDFSDEQKRKRAFINVLGARLAMKLLFSKKIEANNMYSMYTIHSILDELDLADIYYQGLKLDVRLVFNKNEIFIPKSHYRNNLLPDLYLVLCFDENLSSAEFLGFFEPHELDKQNANNDFYFIETESLHKPEKIKDFLNSFVAKNDYIEGETDYQRYEEMFIPLLDKDITTNEKHSLYEALSKSMGLRGKLVEFENFELISKEAGKTPELFKDETLEIVGAQALFGDEEFDNLPIEKQLKEEEKESKFLENSLDALALGLGTAGTIAAGTSAAAALEGAHIASSSADAIAAGLNPGSEAISAGAGLLEGAEKAAAQNVCEESEEIEFLQEPFSNLDELGDDFEIIEEEKEEDNYSVEDTETLDSLDNLDSLDSLVFEESAEELETVSEPDAETEKEQEQEQEPNDEFAALDELDELADTPEITAEEAPEPEPVDEIETETDELTEEIMEFSEIEDTETVEPLEAPAEIENIESQPDLTALEEIGELLPELEDIEKLEELNPEEIEPFANDIEDLTENVNEIEAETGEEPQTEKDDGEVFSLDNFDFNILDENQLEENTDEGNENLISFESKNEIKSQNEDETLNKFMELEADEDDASTKTFETVTKEENSDDDFISQVDELINDINLSEEQKNLLGTTLELQDAEEILAAESNEIKLTETKDTPEINFEEDDEVLKVLFNEDLKEELKDIPVENVESELPEKQKFKPSLEALKNKKMVIAASVAGVVLASFVIGGNIANQSDSSNQIANNQTSAPIAAETANNNELQPLDNTQAQQPIGQLEQQAIPGENQTAEAGRDMGKAVSDAFLSEPVNASVTKVAWEVPEDLAYNDSFRKYLQIAGKNLKLNLQNNLLLATEMAYSNKVIVDMKISKDGNLQDTSVSVSSGSKQIDKIVLQSVKDTLKYLKVPSNELNSPTTDATLIINF